MYLDPIHWVMDNSGLSLLQRESEKEKAKDGKSKSDREKKE